MRKAGRVVGETLQELAQLVRPGADIRDLNTYVEAKYKRLGVVPTFKGYQGYPDVVCVSVNEQLVHGIPGHRILREGDIVSIDLGATVDGFVGDYSAAPSHFVRSKRAWSPSIVRSRRMVFFSPVWTSWSTWSSEW